MGGAEYDTLGRAEIGEQVGPDTKRKRGNTIDGGHGLIDLLPSRCPRNEGVENPGQCVTECTNIAGVVGGSVYFEPFSGFWGTVTTGLHSVWVGPPERDFGCSARS